MALTPMLLVEANIKEEYGDPALGGTVLARMITRADSRVQSWLPDQVIIWVRDKLSGTWPDRILREGEHVAALLIRIELNDDDTEAVEEYERTQELISRMTFDINEDEIRDTFGSSIDLKRHE